jgi:hypothetical protein
MNIETETLIYRNMAIRLVPEIRKKRLQYWIFINNNPLTFVTNKETAKRIAVNFIDVVKGEGYMDSRQCYMEKS